LYLGLKNKYFQMAVAIFHTPLTLVLIFC
jgi:hypothetical protein